MTAPAEGPLARYLMADHQRLDAPLLARAARDPDAFDHGAFEAAGDPARAQTLLEDAVDAFEATAAPFEAAVTRIELAASLSALNRGVRDALQPGRAWRPGRVPLRVPAGRRRGKVEVELELSAWASICARFALAPVSSC